MKSKKVLLVDDEPHILFILEKELIKHECIVKKVENGDEALKYLQNNDVDMIILDIMMPEISGIEVCKKIKANPKTKNKPVIMLTADQDENDKEECIRMGVTDYITKPFSPKNLANKVKEILEKYSGQ